MQGDELPAVKSCSDVAWMLWKMFGEHAGNIKNLRFFLSLSIINAETDAILSRAIRNIVPEAQQFPAWGGYEFDTDTPEGQAILGKFCLRSNNIIYHTDQRLTSGTPNAQAFSYLLLQHKADLGNLYISKIRVFHDDRQRPGPNLLLIVEPVPVNSEVPRPEDRQTKPISGLFSTHTRQNDAINRIKAAPDLVNITAVDPKSLPATLPLTVPPKPGAGQKGGFLNLYENAEDTEWEKSRCKGERFLHAMRGSDNEAGKLFEPPRDTAAGAFDETHLSRALACSYPRPEH